jgi:hypothetical protein
MAIFDRKKTLRRLFTDPARRVLASEQGPAPIEKLQMDVLESVQPVILVGRDVTTDGQTLDAIIAGRRVIVGGVATGAMMDPRLLVQHLSVEGVVATGSALPDIAVGRYFEGNTTTADGTDATWPLTIASGLAGLWEILMAVGSVGADATVATRTFVVNLVTGLGIVAGLTGGVHTTTAITLTASEEGSAFLTNNGLALLNDNGTITEDAIPSPFPTLIDAGGSLTCNVTTGQATDAVQISLFGRRVA